jgi:GST-like protein
MIDLYTWTTPNGRKVSIMLEELGLSYTVHPVNIGADEQFDPAFVKLNPYSKIPVITDADGPDGEPITVFDSGAILIYLAEKTGSGLLPSASRARYVVLQWLMFQMSGVGPMFGQVHHFHRHAKEDVPYAKERYATEQRRVYAVLDGRLADNAFIAGGDYSIADVATYPWVARHEWHPINLAVDYPNVKRWFDQVSERPGVKRGMDVPRLD